MKTGDIVYLKVGSPPMVVNGIGRTDGLITVEWFNVATLYRESFDPECLFLESPELEELRLQCAGNVRAMHREFGPEKMLNIHEEIEQLEHRIGILEAVVQP